ncbi:MAG: PIN domain-containing protein [Chloroflexi bacterium]|nr:MAG: PIN domain-containing protein [Chloroflexota bacterium]
MPGPYTLDASVFLNSFNKLEPGHDNSLKLLSILNNEGIPIIVPALLLPEVAAAVSRGTDKADLAYRFAASLARLPHLVLVNLDPILAHQSAEIAARYRLRGSDAVYAAAAQRFNCPLVTLDHQQHDRIAKVLPVMYPTDALKEFG